MSWMNVSLVLIVTFFACGFWADFTTDTIFEKNPSAAASDLEHHCRALREKYSGLSTKKVAKELYKKAFALSFGQDWQTAETASACAALLYRGDQHWAIEANNFLH